MEDDVRTIKDSRQCRRALPAFRGIVQESGAPRLPIQMHISDGFETAADVSDSDPGNTRWEVLTHAVFVRTST